MLLALNFTLHMGLQINEWRRSKTQYAHSDCRQLNIMNGNLAIVIVASCDVFRVPSIKENILVVWNRFLSYICKL